MTAAVPLPTPEPATAEDLGHPIRYRLKVGDVYTARCKCHYGVPIVGPEVEEK